MRVRARQGAELSEWTELTSGGVYTLAVEPGVLTVGLQVLDGDRLNLNGPASHSLGLVELGLGGNPSGTEMAVKLGQGSNTWLRLVDVGGRVDVFADASGPDWRPATDWAGKRLRGLAAGFELHLYAQARNGDGEPTALRPVVAHKGVVRWTITTRGKSAHAAEPTAGVNAIYPILHRINLPHLMLALPKDWRLYSMLNVCEPAESVPCHDTPIGR